MQIGTYPLSHLGLRVSDLARAKRFYVDTLGFGLLRETPGKVFIDAHGMLFALIGQAEQTDTADRFDPFRIGLDHLALAIADAGELEGLREQLDAAKVPNHGIEPDPATGATYISFYDPDGIAWELYALPPQ
jgi:catechol 2,3-dioxygenase-like lactoylglutathione lyase family enzyme